MSTSLSSGELGDLLRRLEHRADRRRRSRDRRRRWRSPSGRGRGRPGPSWQPGCAACAGFFCEGVDLVLDPRRRPDCRRAPCDRRREMVWTSATWRPNAFSSASDISPTVAPARAARIENSSRLPSPCAASASASSAVSTAATSRVPLSCCSLASWRARTSALSIFSTSTSVSVSRPVGVDADQRLLAGIDARLRARRGFLDAQLRHALLDRGRHAAERLDLLDMARAPAPPDHASAARRRPSRPMGR